MFIELILQGRENYGTADRPYWKNKFAEDYLLPVNQALFDAADDKQRFLVNLVDRVAPLINQNGKMWQQHIIDWQLVPDEHYTDSELNQLEYEGHIRYWAKIIDLPVTTG